MKKYHNKVQQKEIHVPDNASITGPADDKVIVELSE